MDQNRRHHIFGEPRHHLGPLVQEYGGEEAAGEAIEDAVRLAFESDVLTVADDGCFTCTINIGSHHVTVRGRVINGVARVGTAWISP